MAKSKKSGGGSQFTYVIASVLMLLLVLLAYRSCSRSDGDALANEASIRANYEDSLQAAAEAEAYEAEVQARAEALLRAQTQPPIGDSLVRNPNLGSQQVIRQRYTPLYVCVDFANVRSGPGLNHGKIDRLSLYDEVEFLGEKTDSTYRIDLGEITPNAPWVKVKTQSGNVGWIYGACVHYYKYRLDGVVTD